MGRSNKVRENAGTTGDYPSKQAKEEPVRDLQKVIKPGFFQIGDLQACGNLSFVEARNHALNCIKAQAGARPDNAKKAQQAVMKAHNLKGLLITMANFMLAHPSEGLKV